MIGRFPLSTLLSQALVAYTVEFDNEAERRIPHTTTGHGRTPGMLPAPWLVSMAMWFNCMQHVGDEGVTQRELERLARTPTNLNGMIRWRYVTFTPDPADPRPKPPRAAWLIRPTPGGRMAQQIWRPLFGVIEKRWDERFGNPEIRQLRDSLTRIAGQLDSGLPDCLPILGYGLFTSRPFAKGPRSKAANRDIGVLPVRDRSPASAAAQVIGSAGHHLPLPALLARVLLAFAVEFESHSEVSLAIGANVLRLFDEAGDSARQSIRIRDFPRLAGVSKESIAMAAGFLNKRGYAEIQSESADSKVKAMVLTPKGRRARDAYHRLLREIEHRWEEQFGREAIAQLRGSLEPLAGDGTRQGSPLFGGLEPYPGSWRAAVREPEVLPHFPMVLHRGGYPDGS